MQQSTPTRLRSACDVCHQSKVKCSGGSPCHGCQRIGIACNYSSSNQNGRPRGVRNKKTLQRMQAAAANAARENESKKLMQPTPPGNAGMSDPTIEPLVELGTSTGDLEEMNIGMSSFPDDLPEHDFANIEFPKLLSHDDLFFDKSFPSPINISKADDGLNMLDHENESKTDRDTSRLKCECLQQLATQLVQLKSYSRHSEQLPQTAWALPYVRDAVFTWQHYYQCRLCQKSGDHDAVVLVVMGIRALLSIIENLSHQLHFGGQFVLSLHSSPDSSIRSSPTTYGLAHDESQAVMHALLQRNMNTIISILRGIKNHMYSDNDFQENSISASGFTEQALPSPPFTTLSTDFPTSSIFSSQSLERPLEELIECAEGLRQRISNNH